MKALQHFHLALQCEGLQKWVLLSLFFILTGVSQEFEGSTPSDEDTSRK